MTKKTHSSGKKVLEFIALLLLFVALIFVYVKLKGTEEPINDSNPVEVVTEYHFRNKKLLNEHYEKHGKEMGFANAEEYEKAASAVINNKAALYKTEKEDGDGVYFVESTGEFVILSTDGYIRTYFIPDSGKKYFDKQ